MCMPFSRVRNLIAQQLLKLRKKLRCQSAGKKFIFKRKGGMKEMRKKQIEGFPHLELYDNGTILNTKTGRRMKGSVRKDGYVRFHLKSNGLDTTPMAHMLVAKYFVPNPNNYTYVIHKDGDLSNNCADNLEWVKLPPGLENVTKKTPKRGKTYQKSQEETEEKWRRIGEHPTYLISSFGRVMNTKTKKLL